MSSLFDVNESLPIVKNGFVKSDNRVKHSDLLVAIPNEQFLYGLGYQSSGKVVLLEV